VTFKYGYEEEGLYVEQGTDRVPDDGRFYILLRGQVIENEATAKRALARLQQLLVNPLTDEALAGGQDMRARILENEMAARHLRESTAEKTAQYGRKGRKG